MINLIKAIDEIYNLSTYPMEDSAVLDEIFKIYQEVERKEYTAENHKQAAVFMKDKGPSELTAFVQFSNINGIVKVEKAIAGKAEDIYQFFKEYSF